MKRQLPITLPAIALIYTASAFVGCGNGDSEKDSAAENPDSQTMTDDDFEDAELSSRWEISTNGCKVECRNGELRIQGKVEEHGWEQWNGIETKNTFPEGDFTVSFDFNVPQFVGAGARLVTLDANEVEGDQSWVSLFFSVGGVYGMNTGPLNPTPDSVVFAKSNLQPFGDENETFHRLRLVYDSKQEVLTGYVDDQQIGTLEVELVGPSKFTLRVGTEAADVEVNVLYDNFRYTPSIN
jgi:hypothetical protein